MRVTEEQLEASLKINRSVATETRRFRQPKHYRQPENPITRLQAA